jgi:hypothetical protein
MYKRNDRWAALWPTPSVGHSRHNMVGLALVCTRVTRCGFCVHLPWWAFVILWCFCGALAGPYVPRDLLCCPTPTEILSLLDIAAAWLLRPNPQLLFTWKRQTPSEMLVNAAAKRGREIHLSSEMCDRRRESIERAFHSIQIGWKVKTEMHFYLIYLFIF